MLDFFKSSSKNFDVELTEWKLNVSEALMKESTFWSLGIKDKSLYLIQVEDPKLGFPVAPNQRMKGFWRVELPGRNPKEMSDWFGNYVVKSETVVKGKKQFELERVKEEADS